MVLVSMYLLLKFKQKMHLYYNIKLLQFVYFSEYTYLQSERTLMLQRFEFLQYCTY